MTTPRLGAPELPTGQNASPETMNEALRWVEQGAGYFIVKDKDLATPPGSPTVGDCYIVAGSPTGAWTGWATRLAFRLSTSWEDITPIEGTLAYVQDENLVYKFDGAAWGDYQPTAPSLALDDLTDVVATAPDDGDTIVWDSGAGEWQSAPLPGGGGGGGTVPDGGSTGQVLAKASGTDQDTEWRTQNSYEAGPPTPATTADLATWDNQGTSTATDGTGAMVLKPQVDAVMHGRYKTAPATPYDLYCRVEIGILGSSSTGTSYHAAAGIMFKDTGGDNERLTFVSYHEHSAAGGDDAKIYSAGIQRWTGASPPVLSASPVFKYASVPWKWLRVNNDGTTLTFYVSTDGKNWISVGTETLAAFIDAAASYGVAAYAAAAATEVAALFSYFSTTAPS